MSDQPAPQELRWTLDATAEGRRKRAVVFVVAAIASVLGFVFVHSPVAAAFGGVAVLGATAEAWMGSSYRLDASSVNARVGVSVTSMEWKDVRRVVFEPGHALVSPIEDDGTLSRFRGVRLAFGDELEAQVRQFIEERCGGHARILG